MPHDFFPGINYFMPVHEYLKGYLACMDISFTLREMFFLYFARFPASYNFANDPSLSILYCLVAVKCQFFGQKEPFYDVRVAG